MLWVLGGLLGAHFVVLEVPEGSKKHIRCSEAIILRILCVRRGSLAAISDAPEAAQGCPRGPQMEPQGVPFGPQTGRRRHLIEKT